MGAATVQKTNPSIPAGLIKDCPTARLDNKETQPLQTFSSFVGQETKTEAKPAYQLQPKEMHKDTVKPSVSNSPNSAERAKDIKKRDPEHSARKADKPKAVETLEEKADTVTPPIENQTSQDSVEEKALEEINPSAARETEELDREHPEGAILSFYLPQEAMPKVKVDERSQFTDEFQEQQESGSSINPLEGMPEKNETQDQVDTEDRKPKNLSDLSGNEETVKASGDSQEAIEQMAAKTPTADLEARATAVEKPSVQIENPNLSRAQVRENLLLVRAEQEGEVSSAIDENQIKAVLEFEASSQLVSEQKPLPKDSLALSSLNETLAGILQVENANSAFEQDLTNSFSQSEMSLALNNLEGTDTESILAAEFEQALGAESTSNLAAAASLSPAVPELGEIQISKAMEKFQPGQELAESVKIQTMQIVAPVEGKPGKLMLQLSPESLGKVEVEVNIAADGRIDAVVNIERSETYDLFRQDQRELQQVIADAFKAETEQMNFTLNYQQQQADQHQLYTLQEDYMAGHATNQNDDLASAASLKPQPRVDANRALDQLI